MILAKSPSGLNTLPFFEFQPAATMVWVGNNSSSKLTGTTAFGTSWMFVVMARISNVGSLYINGNLEASATNNDNYNHSNTDTMRVGLRQDGWRGSSDQECALLRISATAPTAAQILEIYNAEKPLFQENGKCVLNGTSDAVQCLAYDDSTELLHVGTSGGRSTFQGLRRVDETATNTTEISAQGGMIIEETA